MSLDRDVDLQDRPAGSPIGFDGGFDRQERNDGEVSLDRLADVINDVLSVAPSESLALLIQTQLARAAAPEFRDSDLAALPEDVDS